jgi:VCBS repeat-containing protein
MLPSPTRGRGLAGAILGSLLAVPITAVIALGATPAACTITGGPGGEVLNGTPAADVICGLGGNDTLKGVAGNDILRGGDGDDVLIGGGGADRFEGEAGAADRVDYGSQTQPVTVSIGDGANDGLRGGTEADDVRADVERISGGRGSDVLTGDAAANHLLGGDGADALDAGDGDDRLTGGGGADSFAGGAGTDTVLYNGVTGAVLASIGDGANDGVGGTEGDDVHGDIERLTGGSGSDRLTGDADANTLDGAGGADALDGGGGHDLLVGGPGPDDFTGGAGVDTVSYVGVTQPVIASIGGPADGDGVGGTEGDDIGAGIEGIRGGSGDDQLSGNGSPNTLTGLTGDDTLDGGAANDRLLGGDGGDDLTAGAGADRLEGEGGPDDLHADGDGPNADQLNCGAAADRAFADPADTLDASCESQPPTANDDTLTVSEDDHNDADGANVDVLANDSDPEGRTLTVASVDTTGTVGLVTHSGTVNYRTNGEFRHLNVGATASDSFTYKANDGTADSLSATVSITITGVNDAPVVNVASSTLAHTENVAVAVDPDLTISDRDSPNLAGAQVRISNNFQADDQLVFANQEGISGTYDTGTGVLTLTGSESVADYQTALRSIQFNTTGQDPSTLTRTVEFKVDDGAAADHESNLATRDISVARVNDAPVADDESFSGAVGNTRLAVGTTSTGPRITSAGDVLSGDVDPDTPAANLAVTPASLTSGQCAVSSCGPNVTMESDGQFTYDPPQGFTGDDTFVYTVEDNDTGDGDGEKTAVALVTINVSGPMTWYVDGDAPVPAAGTGGRSHTPFKSLADLTTGGSADGKDGTGDTIFLYDAATAYDGGIVLEDDQLLLGEPNGLSVSSQPLVSGGSSDPSTNPDIRNTSGDAITLADGSWIQRVNVAGASGDGIVGTGIGGSVQVGAPSTISGVDGTDVRLSGGNGSVQIASNITNSSGRSIHVENRTFPGSVSFEGTVTDTGGGILLDNNDSSFVGFSGGLTLNTGASAALQAINGGHVWTGTFAANTIATTTGTALRVENTSINPQLRFRSISSNGAADGIVLNNTGGPGGLTVTGNGGTCTPADTTGCSGGVIANSIAADDSGVMPAGTGIVLRDTSNVSLTRMWIHDHSNYGIRGTNVNGFELTRSTVNATGAGGTAYNGTASGAGFNEGGARFTGLTGTARVTDSHLSRGYGDNFRVVNGPFTSLNITFSGTTVGANHAVAGEDGVRLETTGGSSGLSATFTNHTSTFSRGDHIQYAHNGSQPGNLNITAGNFSNSSVPSSGGLNLASDADAGSTAMTIANNDFSGARGPAVAIAKTPGSGSAVLSGSFTGNSIGAAGQGTSGSSEADALRLDNAQNGALNWTISGNDIHGYHENGIVVYAGGAVAGASGAVNTTIVNNTLDSPSPQSIQPKYGIRYDIGLGAGDTFNACADVRNNDLHAAGVDMLGGVAGDVDALFIQRANTTIRLPGYGGGAADRSAVEAFIRDNNLVGGTPAILAPVSGSGGGYTGGGSTCP